MLKAAPTMSSRTLIGEFEAMRSLRLSLPFLAFISTACGPTAIYESGSVETATTRELCQVIHWKRNGFDYGADEAFEELQERREFTPRELSGISIGVPEVGFSEQAALCTRGFFYDDVNVTQTAFSLSKQYIFRDVGLYVYTDGNKVTTIQF